MIQLPADIAAYVEAANAHDAARMAACFDPEGMVRDEGRLYRGAAEIAGWAAHTSVLYRPAIEPAGFEQADGHYRMRALVRGNFPGSPVALIFKVEPGANGIRSLEIGPGG